MSRSLKAIALSLALAAAVALSFLTGEIIGMKSGYAYSQKVTAPMEAAYIVSVIALIENGMSDKAGEMLDTKLDNYVIDHWAASRCRLTSVNPFLGERDNAGLFSSTIAYRNLHPSENSTVQLHLENLKNGPGTE